MSLIAWYPLITNGVNQGLDNTNLSTMGSIPYSAGKIGNAASFSGNAANCLHRPGFKLTDNFTWACWIKITASSSANQFILSEGRDDEKYGMNLVIHSSGSIKLMYGTNSSLTILSSSSLNTWYHIAISVSSVKGIKCYVNGTLTASGVFVKPDYTYSSDRFTVGKMSYSYTSTTNYFPFNGAINDIRIYNHALSTKEVKEISKGLVLHFSFNDIGFENIASNIIEFDKSGFLNNGTKVGALAYSNNTPRYNTCLVFGNNKYITFQNPINSSSTEFSISCWAKFNSISGNSTFCTMRTKVGNGIAFFRIGANFRLDDNSQATFSSYTIPVNTWIHIVVTRNNTSKKLYINGELKQTINTVGDMNNIYSIGSIGASSNSGTNFNNFTDGSYSDFRIYATALSADDIKELYQIPLAVDKVGNSYAYGYLEKESPNISKTGILENKEINESSIVNYIEKAYQGKSYSYTPSTGNNSCMNNIIVNYSDYTPGEKLYVKIDVEWSGFDETNTSGTFNIYFQGSQYSTSSGSFIWSGTNYACSALNKAQPLKNLVLSSTTGKKTIVGSFISNTYPSEYNRAYIGIRTDYSNGTAKLKISNAEVIPEKYYISNNFQMGKNYLTANQIIEY